MRGQGCDKSVNMSCMYTGVQARIKALNLLAYYVPCVFLSLNLVGTFAASSYPVSVSYFSFSQALCNFVSASTYRYYHFKASLDPNGNVVKLSFEPCDSARTDVNKAVYVQEAEMKSER